MTCHALIHPRTELEQRLLDPYYLPPLADDVEWRDEEHKPVSGRQILERRAGASKASPPIGQLRAGGLSPSGECTDRAKEGFSGNSISVPRTSRAKGLSAHPLDGKAAARRAPVTASGRLRSLLRVFSAEHPVQFARPPIAQRPPALRALSPEAASGLSFSDLRRGPAKNGGGRLGFPRGRPPSILSTLSSAVQFASFLLAVSSWGLLILFLGSEMTR